MLSRTYRDIARAVLYGAITNTIYRNVKLLVRLADHYNSRDIADKVQSDERVDRALNDLTDAIIDSIDKQT